MNIKTENRFLKMKDIRDAIDAWCNLVESCGNEMAYTDNIARYIKDRMSEIVLDIDNEVENF